MTVVNTFAPIIYLPIYLIVINVRMYKKVLKLDCIFMKNKK